MSCRHDDEREQAYESSRATSDELIVAGAFAVVLVNVTGAGVVVALRAAGVDVALQHESLSGRRTTYHHCFHRGNPDLPQMRNSRGMSQGCVYLSLRAADPACFFIPWGREGQWSHRTCSRIFLLCKAHVRDLTTKCTFCTQ